MIIGKDKVKAHLDKSTISNIIQTARASLKEPSRPFTPGDTQRALFSTSDSTRPPSAYSIKTLSKELEPLKQRPVFSDIPIQTKRKVMSEESKSMPRKPIKAIQEVDYIKFKEKDSEINKKKKNDSEKIIEKEIIQEIDDNIIEDDEENNILIETKEIIENLDKIRYDIKFRESFTNNDLDLLLDNINDILVELKYSNNKPQWAYCEEILKILALTLENFDQDAIKILKISKCLLENIINHDLLYKKSVKGLVTNTLAMGAIKILYQLSKSSENDKLFYEEDLFDTMYTLLINIVSEDSYNEIELPYDFLLFLLGILKNISIFPQIGEISYKLLSPLASLLPTPFLDTDPHKNSKHSSLLVQVSGILSHISSESALDSFMSYQIIEKLCISIEIYHDQDIVLNSLKALSKISVENLVCNILTPYIYVFFHTIQEFNSPMIISRSCYILANAIAVNKKVLKVSNDIYISLIMRTAIQYIGNYELIIVDLLVKCIRLLANLANIEDVVAQLENGEGLLKLLNDILINYNVSEHEELILNTVACMSNLLYFDYPDATFITPHIRIIAFTKISSILVNSFNEEIISQALRTLSNLTRHESICKTLSSLHILDILLMLLDHSNWDIVYFTLGCFINISSLSKELLYSENCFDLFINLLHDTCFCELEFTKQLFMIFCNLCSLSKMLVPWESVAGEENVEKLNGIVKSVVEKNKNIENKNELMQELIEVGENLIEFMPKPFVPCTFQGCGRKFPTNELLKEHWNRRHT